MEELYCLQLPHAGGAPRRGIYRIRCQDTRKPGQTQHFVLAYRHLQPWQET